MPANLLELHDVDVPEFLKLLDRCQGNVYLVTREGDRLNLKSKLCQLVGLTKLIEGGKIAEAFIECENKDDESMLFRFNLFGDSAVTDQKDPLLPSARGRCILLAGSRKGASFLPLREPGKENLCRRENDMPNAHAAVRRGWACWRCSSWRRPGSCAIWG